MIIVNGRASDVSSCHSRYIFDDLGQHSHSLQWALPLIETGYRISEHTVGHRHSTNGIHVKCSALHDNIFGGVIDFSITAAHNSPEPDSPVVSCNKNRFALWLNDFST